MRLPFPLKPGESNEDDGIELGMNVEFLSSIRLHEKEIPWQQLPKAEYPKSVRM